MTEQEWNTCANPEIMLEHIARRRTPARAKERKLTLFACAACRQIWDLLPTDSCQSAVEVSERYADDLATDQDRNAAWHSAFASVVKAGIRLDDEYKLESIEWGYVAGGLAAQAALGVVGAGNVNAGEVASNAMRELVLQACGIGYEATEDYHETVEKVQSTQCVLLRDIFGNPFHPITLNPGCLTLTVVKLAKAIYDERAFGSLPILADALEEAGCRDDEIISHCRSTGPHFLGCWVMDLIQGKS